MNPVKYEQMQLQVDPVLLVNTFPATAFPPVKLSTRRVGRTAVRKQREPRNKGDAVSPPPLPPTYPTPIPISLREERGQREF